MQNYLKTIIAIYPFLLAILGLILLVYIRIKRISNESYNYLLKGIILCSLSILVPKTSSLFSVNPAFHLTIDILALTLVAYGFYMVLKIIKATQNYESIDIKKNAAFTFGLLSFLLIPISGLVSMGLFLDLFFVNTRNTQLQWKLIIETVFSGSLSVFFFIVGLRLLKIRKGWKGKLFAPYTLWLQLPGGLFLVVGFIELFKRDLVGFGAISIAVILILVSGKVMKITGKAA